MLKPTHPGETLREDILPALGLTVAEAAAQLGVPTDDLARVLNEDEPITAELAVRIEAWLGADTGGDAQHWMAMQASHDLWHVRQRGVAADVSLALGEPPQPNDISLQEPISFCGEFDVSPCEFTLETTRFIVGPDSLKFDLAGKTPGYGAFRTSAVAARIGDLKFKVSPVETHFVDSKEQTQRGVIEFACTLDDDLATCNVLGTWSEDEQSWQLTACLERFRPPTVQQ